jgi:hypothetical protein
MGMYCWCHEIPIENGLYEVRAQYNFWEYRFVMASRENPMKDKQPSWYVYKKQKPPVISQMEIKQV